MDIALAQPASPPLASSSTPSLATLARLRDGTRVRVRPVEPGDRARLREVFERLSPESRYQRFMAGIACLSDSQLRDFTEIDHASREAWIAFDADIPGEPAIGVAQYARLETARDVAEIAVTVVDSHQGRGLGTLLLCLATRSAAAHGIETFRAYTFDSNTAMVRILRDLGARVRRADSGVLCFDVPVSQDIDRCPDTSTGRAFRAIASGTAGTIP